MEMAAAKGKIVMPLMARVTVASFLGRTSLENLQNFSPVDVGWLMLVGVGWCWLVGVHHRHKSAAVTLFTYKVSYAR